MLLPKYRSLTFCSFWQLSVERLSSMKKYVFGLGSAQVTWNIELSAFRYVLGLLRHLAFLLLSWNISAGADNSRSSWHGGPFCFKTGRSCSNSNWQWLGFVINCCRPAGSIYSWWWYLYFISYIFPVIGVVVLNSIIIHNINSLLLNYLLFWQIYTAIIPFCLVCLNICSLALAYGNQKCLCSQLHILDP